jgi:hypothetical protein
MIGQEWWPNALAAAVVTVAAQQLHLLRMDVLCDNNFTIYLTIFDHFLIHMTHLLAVKLNANVLIYWAMYFIYLTT